MKIERIITSVPVNAEAARVVEEGGEDWCPTLKDTEHCYDTPPPMRPIPIDPGFIDLKRGRARTHGRGRTIR